MSEQLDMVYDYMIRKGKTLTPQRKCRMCDTEKQNFEFYTRTNVCIECWHDYVKLTKRERKELLWER